MIIRMFSLLALFSWGASSWADVTLNLQNDSVRLPVDRLVLTGAASGEDKHIDIVSLNRVLRKEREAYAREMTVDELHQIADKLTLYVRERGYMFHTVFLPPQRVKENTVRFKYKAAKLSQINFIDKTGVGEKRLRPMLEDLLNKSLYTPAIDKRILLLKAQQSLAIFAFYSRAESAHDIRLNIKVSERKTHNFSIKAENYGSQSTGENRAVADVTLRNVLSYFDTLSVAALTTMGEGNSTYGFVNYSRPFRSLNTSLNLGVGDTRYSLGSDYSVLEMSGDSKTYRGDITRTVYWTNKQIQHFSFGGYQKKSEVISGFDTGLDNKETSSGFQLATRANFYFANTYAGFSLDAVKGTYKAENSEAGIENLKLLKLGFSLYANRLFIQESKYALGVAMRMRGQYTQDALPSIEAMSLSGIYAVRAIEPGRYSSDRGWIASMDVTAPRLIQFGEQKSFKIIPGVFIDYAQGQSLYEDARYNTKTQLSGWGLSTDIIWKSFSTKVAWGNPLSATISSDVDEQEFEHEKQWIFEARLSF